LTTDEWVRRVNELAREIDEIAASIHPSAWRETLEPEFRKFERLAKVIPDGEAVESKKDKIKRRRERSTYGE
jgi:hypothetical protein